MKLKLQRKQSSYLSDNDEEETKECEAQVDLEQISEIDDEYFAYMIQQETNKENICGGADEAASAASVSTNVDSGLSQVLKDRKKLHYKATYEMDPIDKCAYYADVAYNYCDFKTNGTIKKCDDTIKKVEQMQACNATSASDEIAQLMKKMSQM